MAVFQQCIIDKIPGTPITSGALALTKKNANTGMLVTYAASHATRNKSAYGSAVYELTNAANDIIKGVLGDFHNSRQVSILRKGRIAVRTTDTPADGNIGQGIVAVAPGGSNVNVGKCAASATGIGEIVDYGTHSDPDIGNYYIVDLNLP